MPENLNSTILASAWMAGSTDFQQTVPNPSQARMSEVIESFNLPNAGRLFNEVTGLFTTIGINRIKSNRWENPLSFLEGSFMSYGGNVREIAVRWAKAHSYASDAQTLLKRQLPSMLEAFHQIDRFDRYDTSISRSEFIQSLQPGMGGDDGTGLDTLLGAIFDSVYSPEAYDSMRYTLQTIAEADRAWGLMRENAPAVATKADGENFMAQLESLILRWKYPSTIYNNVEGLPVWTETPDVVIFVQPETLARIDQVLLANLFAGERSEDIRRRIVVVPDFPIPNVRAIVADRNFFVIHRTVFGLESFYNPQQMVTNYYLQSQGVWSASPLANIVLLGDFDSTVIPTVTVAPSALLVNPESGIVAPGGSEYLGVTLEGNVTASGGADTGGIEVDPDSVTWEISAATDKGDPVALNRKTFVDRFNRLHVQKTIPVGSIVSVVATSTYINPSGATVEIKSQPAQITVVKPEDIGILPGEYDKLVYTNKLDGVDMQGAIMDAANTGKGE